jgi:predicted transcriptional regulator
MGEGRDEPMEDIAYLARSSNRVRLLETLAAGAYSRRDLVDRTGIAPATISRIVNEFEDREWAERTSDGIYTATATGSLIVAEFAPLVDAMDTIRTLGEAATWIPTEELSIGIEQFEDAEVRRSPPNAPTSMIDYLAECFREASVARNMTFLDAPAQVVDAMVTAVDEGRLTVEVIFAGGLVDFLLDRGEPPEWSRHVDAGISVYRYDDHIPCHLFLFDDRVLIMNDRPPGGGGFVESEDETVLAAANDLFEGYRDDAEPVEADVFE